MRYDRMREKERIVKEFFATFDTSVLAKRRRLRRRLRWARGEPLLGPDEVKEELAEDLLLDIENHHFNFYYRPTV